MAGLDTIQSALLTLREGGFVLYDLAFRGAVALGLQATGRATESANQLDFALIQSKRTGDEWCLPELQRIRAEVLIEQGDVLAAKQMLKKAMVLSQRQGARSWEAGIAHSLGGLRPS